MIKASAGFQTAVERSFTSMSERRVSKVMGQREGLGKIFVEPERARKRARNLGHFQGMGEAAAKMVAFMKDEHLSLVSQPAKRGRMDNAIAVPAERIARRTCRFGPE